MNLRTDRTRRPSVALSTAAGLLCAFAQLSPVAAQDERTDREGPRVRGAMTGVFARGLDLIGDMGVELPFLIRDNDTIYVSLAARTTIQETQSFKFLLEDLDYSLDVGFRTRGLFSNLPVRAFVGQSGTERVDKSGQSFVRYVGVGAESRGFGSLAPGVQWSGEAAVVLEDRELQADGVVRATARLSFPLRRDANPVFGIDFDLDGLVGDSRLRGDWRFGPFLGVTYGGRRHFAVFVHYIESRNPLGLGVSGLLGGIDIRDSGTPAPDGAAELPDIGGSIAAGAGEGRLAGSLRLRLTSPELPLDLRGIVYVDANLLTAVDTGELYYFYHAGLERAAPGSAVYGLYFYHRSNHQLAEPNNRITATNVVETGAETSGWDRPGAGVGLEWRLRAGYLLDSSFGEDRRWHARGGARWAPFSVRGWAPFALVEAEAGDIERRMYALGVANGNNLEFRLEYREDDQFFGRDRTAVLATANLAF